MNKESSSRAALTCSLNISFFIQPTEESLNGSPGRRNCLRIKVSSGLASLLWIRIGVLKMLDEIFGRFLVLSIDERKRLCIRYLVPEMP